MGKNSYRRVELFICDDYKIIGYPIVELGEFSVVEHLGGVGDVGGHGISFVKRGVPGLVVHPIHFVQRLTELMPLDKTPQCLFVE